MVVLGFYVPPTAKVIDRPVFKVSSERLEKPVMEFTTPGLQGKLNHYTTEASILMYILAVGISNISFK